MRAQYIPMYVVGVIVGMILAILAGSDIPMWLLIGVCFFVGGVGGAIGEWIERALAERESK